VSYIMYMKKKIKLKSDDGDDDDDYIMTMIICTASRISYVILLLKNM